MTPGGFSWTPAVGEGILSKADRQTRVGSVGLSQHTRHAMSQAHHNEYLLSVSGRRISLIDPDPSSFDIEDIAHALSMIPRFNGNLPVCYTVASHSTLVASLVGEEVRLAALLHDASEAFLCDIPSPLKAMIPEYRKIEERVQAAIHVAFGMPAILPAAWQREIKRADLVMLATEKQQLMAIDDGHWPVLAGIETAPFDLLAHYCGHGEEPKRRFLQSYRQCRSLTTS